MIRDDVVRALVATGKWSESAARLAERAGYKCEYCGFDLLASVEAYKLFEIDHIVPLCEGGDPIAFENLALSCRHCNFHLKRSWYPRTAATKDADRAQLINAVKDYITSLRTSRVEALQNIWRIVGYAQKNT